MTEKLVEAVAGRMAQAQGFTPGTRVYAMSLPSITGYAQLVFNAIEAEGFRVVPVEPETLEAARRIDEQLSVEVHLGEVCRLFTDAKTIARALLSTSTRSVQQ